MAKMTKMDRAIFVVLLMTVSPLAPHAFADSAKPAARIATRSFPSIFEAWNPAENLDTDAEGAVVPLAGVETPAATMARHDFAFLIWNALGLKAADHNILASEFTPESVQAALKRRAELLSLNPHMVVLASIAYRTASGDHSGIPEDSPWWKRDGSGQRVSGGNPQNHQYFLDFSSPEFQAVVAHQCQALVQSGVFDGCMLDWWSEHLADEPVDPDGTYRLQLIKKIRAAIGNDALIIGNTNDKLPEATAPYLNGMFMEGFGAKYFSDWRKAAADLAWGQAHLRKPAITLLEGWYQSSGRNDLALMREVTTLSLTQSNGYVLFADPNSPKTPNHAHDWYPFWDHSLGRPTGPLAQKGPSGSFMREFEKGTAIFNPPANAPVPVHFNDTRSSVATGKSGRDFEVPAGDGDLFLKP